jgi:hypothetical protein
MTRSGRRFGRSLRLSTVYAPRTSAVDATSRAPVSEICRLKQRVAVPAFCDTSPGSVDQRPATTCAAPDDDCVRGRTPRSQPALTPHGPMLTPRQVDAAQVEPIVSTNHAHQTKQTSWESVLVSPPEPESPPNAHHRSPVSAGEVEHCQCAKGISIRTLRRCVISGWSSRRASRRSRTCRG